MKGSFEGWFTRYVLHCLTLMLLALCSSAFAKDIVVKYRDKPVNISNGHFESPSLKASSLVNEIHYDKSNQYLIIQLQSTRYHYCGIPAPVVNNWVAAPSLGSFYIANVKGRYDCRVVLPPKY